MLVFGRIFHLGSMEIGYEEGAVFDRVDFFNFKTGGYVDGCGQSYPTDRDIGADLLTLEKAVWRIPV